MTRDKRIWGDDSDIFNPDRFLSPPKPGTPAHPDPTSLAFGFGRRYAHGHLPCTYSCSITPSISLRRVCVGRALALHVVMQFAAATVSAYEIVLCETDDGKTLTPETTTFHEETIR
jgi:cytochrome P450